MQLYEDGFGAGDVSNGSATVLSIAIGLVAFGVGVVIFLAALIGFSWLF